MTNSPLLGRPGLISLGSCFPVSGDRCYRFEICKAFAAFLQWVFSPREDADLLDENTQPAISLLIGASEQGDKAATEALFATLYAELRRMAKRELGKRAGFVSISATTLLHQAYLDMSEREGQSFPDRARFMAYAARVMRTLIIDHARERHAQKRGGLFEITSLDTNAMENSVDHREVTQIGDALDELAKDEPELAEIVDLKFFCGLSFAEIAALRNVSERTVQRNWERARLYLHRQIRADLPA
jgi:RNA polymerase sigma factor (TIGR02999 family)